MKNPSNRTLFPIRCKQCGNIGHRPRNEINRAARTGRDLFCSRGCVAKAQRVSGARPTIRRYIRNNVPHAFSLKDRLDFYSIPEPNTGCFLWIGHLSSRGYAKIRVKNVTHIAHRAAWEVHRGPIPDGMHVCHRCDVRSCINPDHLFIGTHQDNMDDRDRKGRQARGETSPLAKLTAQQALEIYGKPGRHADIAQAFGVCKATVTAIKSRRLWREITANAAIEAIQKQLDIEEGR